MALSNEISQKFPLFSLYHRPHTHSRAASPFRTQTDSLDHRTHTLHGRTSSYGFMALINEISQNTHTHTHMQAC